jgi:tetratricopeptide (TPR) repeat protein
MTFGGKLSFGALSRLAAACAAAYARGAVADDPNFGGALAAFTTVAAGYLTSRASAVENEFKQQILASKNNHLQLALAGAFRNTLEELAPRHSTHKTLFDAWDAILDAALDRATTLLPIVIPAEFDPPLDAANPYAEQTSAFEEAENLLRFWLAYQQAFERTGSYPAVPPSTGPELPTDLQESLQNEFLPTFQRAFASLLLQNGSEYARRAFEGRHLQELVGRSRKHTVILGGLDAQFLLPLAPLSAPESIDETRELEVLRAENRAIPVVGREADLSDLHAWLKSPAPVSCRILTGPAGAGKTRLAIQLVEELGGSRWRSGFLREFTNVNQRHWDQPTLAIVDYAATVAQSLKAWLAHLADQTPAQPLRVLLLEREANPESGWLRLLLDHTSTGHRIASLLDPPTPQRISPLADVQVRRQILEATLKKLGMKWELPPPGRDSLFDQRLAEPRWQDPLYLMMAALAARQFGGLPQALSLTRIDLAFRLGDRELDRIGKFLPAGAPPESARLLKHLAGIITACRTLERADLLPIAKEEAALLGLEFPGGPRVAAERIAEALNRQGRPAPVEPDIIGEAILLRAFGGENLGEGFPALIRAARRADRRHASNVCFAVTRTCQDFAGDQCHDPLDWVEGFIQTGGSDDLGLLFELERQMPHDTLVLRERAVRVDELLLARFRRLQETQPSEESQIILAGLANNLANRLRHLGRYEEALAEAEESVHICRRMAQERPGAFLPDLAMTLNTLAAMLRDLGRREEALANSEEAVRIYRQLAQQRPDAYQPNLALSLNNLTNMLGDLGRCEEALAQAEEAVRIYRQLAQQRPDAFLPNLATSLNNLANMLSDLGRRQEALAQSEEAVRLNRQLAQQRSDAFVPQLAMSLNNLANRLSDLGRLEEALAQSGEAVGICRRLAQRRPDAFLSDLARSLHNLTLVLTRLGRLEEALAQAEDAVRIRRQMAQQRPDAFLPNLAASLNTLAAILSALGRVDEALAQTEDAVRLYTQLAEQRPDVFLPDLATSLSNLANRLSGLGRREEALTQAEEAVRIRRQLAQQRPDAFLPDLAGSLNNLAVMLSGLGRREEALAKSEEAVPLYRQLAQRRPDAFLLNLAGSLNNLADMLSEVGRREEALAKSEEAVRICGQMVQQRPDAFLPDLARSLNNLTNRLSGLGRREEALAQAEEAVRIYRQLAQQRPDAFVPYLATSLNNLANRLNDLGRREEALAQAEEALRIRRQLAQKCPDAFLPDLAMSLNNLAAMLQSGLGRREEALSQSEEAVRIRRHLAQKCPDAFQPDLARSLAVFGNIIAEDRPGEALEPLTEAVRLLTPFFSDLPLAHGRLMRDICGGYLRTAGAAKVAPDGALLGPVIAVFDRVNSAESPES